MGIDPSHMDLQHLANDHYTTSPTGESSYFCMVWYGMVWYGMVTTLQELLVKPHIFLSQLISCF